ncbi:MAG: thiol-disulfide oxidoreductase DCC family protein [Prolixibacteraceae bacterium]
MMTSAETPIILFDGVCNLCNTSIQFILKFEKQPYFSFGTLQSESGQQALNRFKSQTITDSVLLIENNKLYQESEAALRIAKHLNYFWIFYYFIYLPKWMRDPVYRWIARNRFKWFGKRTSCMIPSPDINERFI